MTDRLILSALIGLANAVLVWTVSTVWQTPRVWPGTILAFALTTASTLMLPRSSGRKGRR